jgi:hypothetical protein
VKLLRRLALAIVPAIVMFTCGAFSPFVTPRGPDDGGTRALAAVIGGTVLLLAWNAILFQIRRPDNDRHAAPGRAAGPFGNLPRPAGWPAPAPFDPTAIVRTPPSPAAPATGSPVNRSGPAGIHPTSPATGSPVNRSGPAGIHPASPTTESPVNRSGEAGVHPDQDRPLWPEPAGNPQEPSRLSGSTAAPASSRHIGRVSPPVRQPAHQRAWEENAYRRNDARHRIPPVPHESSTPSRGRHEPQPEVRGRARQD